MLVTYLSEKNEKEVLKLKKKWNVFVALVQDLKVMRAEKVEKDLNKLDNSKEFSRSCQNKILYEIQVFVSIFKMQATLANQYKGYLFKNMMSL